MKVKERYGAAYKHQPVDRAPIRYRTVWRLTRLGRPPFI